MHCFWGNKMKRKIIGILICTLFIVSSFASAMTVKVNKTNDINTRITNLLGILKEGLDGA